MMKDNLEGRTLIVGVTSSSVPSPYREMIDHTDKVLKVVELLRSHLNFTCKLIAMPVATGLGVRHENGSWSGLIGMLKRKELDVIASRVPLLPSYRGAIDISIPLGEDDWVTLQKQPSRVNSLTALLSPFEIEVWLLLVLSVVGMIPIMFVIYRIYLKINPNATNIFRGRIGDYILFVVVSLLRQDHKLRISIHSQRVLMATWWIAGILLTTFYTANLTASLARPFRERSLQHPRELIWPSYKEVNWLALNDSHTQGLIQSQNPLNQHLKTGRGNLVGSIQDALNLTTRGYVWFGPLDVLFEVMLANYRLNQAKNVTASKLCSFLITDKSYLRIEYGLAFAKNSSLTPLFNRALRLIDQSGILEYSRRPSFTGKNPCSIQGGYTARSMQLGDFLGLFCITIAGLSFGTIVFIGEKITFRWRKWREKKKTNPRLLSSVSTVYDAVPIRIPLGKISNEIQRTHFQVELEIEKLTEEIDRMLLTDNEIRSILEEFIYNK